jgi:hypothetical protein
MRPLLLALILLALSLFAAESAAARIRRAIQTQLTPALGSTGVTC